MKKRGWESGLSQWQMLRIETLRKGVMGGIRSGKSKPKLKLVSVSRDGVNVHSHQYNIERKIQLGA